MYRPSGRARRLFCRVIFPGKRSRRKPGRYGIGPYGGAGGVVAKWWSLWQGGVRGGMRASRPTDVLQVLHQPGTPPASDAGNPCRGGFHIRPGCWRHRKPGRYGIGPYGGAGGVAAKRRRLWRGGVRGGMRASRPTDVLQVLHQPGTPPASDAGNPCRGGFHIRPGCWRHRKPGRYGIGPYSGAGGVAAKGGVYGGAGLRQKRHFCIPHKEIYARRRKLRAYILRDIGRGARFSAARLCGRFTGSPRRGGI